MTRKRPSEKIIKRLFALSGNQCAFSECSQLMVEEGTLIGEVCHIEAANPGGERYNPEQTDDERCAFENLILLCANHHRLTNNVERFPVARLQEMKRIHEGEATKKEFEVSDDIVVKALSAIIYCESLSVNTKSANINVFTTSPDQQHPSIEPNFERIHLGNQFVEPFVVLTLNFSLPLVNKSNVKAIDWAVHIRAPYMGVESTDNKFSKTVPADNEILLRSTEPIFPHQETSLRFSLRVKVKYELESQNRFKSLVFDPIGLGVVDQLPISLTIHCENSEPIVHEYAIHSKTYFQRLNDYYRRKEERAQVRNSTTEDLLNHFTDKESLDSYLAAQGTEDAHSEVIKLMEGFTTKIEELSHQANNLGVSAGGNKYHIVARRSGRGACAIELQWYQTCRNKFDDAHLEVGYWKGLRTIPGSSEVILETPISRPSRKRNSETWRLACIMPNTWKWQSRKTNETCSTEELANHLFSEFAELIKAESQE